MTEMIKVLFLSANPLDTDLRQLNEEARQIDETLRVGSARDSFQLITHLAVRPSDLQELLLRHQPHIVHFSGHGSKTEEIILMDESGASHPVSKQALADLFKILKDNIRIVVLNSCYSKPQAEAISQIIDYTIGINKAIDDTAATAFAAAFYQGLSFGRSVKDAFELGRNVLDLKTIEGSDAPELLPREGVDPTESFLQQKEVMRQDYVDELKSALARLVTGAASDAEAQTIRWAITAGKIILKPDEVSASSPTDEQERLRVTPHRSFVDIETDAKTFRDVQERLYPPPPGIVPPLPGLVFIGREDALHKVKDLLGVKRTPPHADRLTVVRGWPGVGKTTLVGVISRDQEVQKAFPDGVLWTSLYFGQEDLAQSEQEHQLLSLMAAWGRALGTDTLLRVPTLNEAMAQMAALLRHKRMLLIVDDVWEQGHAAPFLQASGSQCAVLVTTRRHTVADELTATRGAVYILPVLTEESALLLLRILAPAIVEQHQDECRELVRDLEYLPLALHVAGGQLKAEAKLGLDVSDLIKGLREGTESIIKATAPLDRSEHGVTPTLSALLDRSIKGLDEQTRECFAFLGAFAPKPATFNLGAMAAVWQMKDPKPIVRTLVGGGLLEPVGNGRFQMHALLVQYARSLLTD
jgi:hypothetical protein